jgi:hypothetical protein
MADYYPLIAKAVAALSPNTPEARQGIYERARTALTRQLASIDPPPAGEIIDREIGALESVIRRIEGEQGHAKASTSDKASTPATILTPPEPGSETLRPAAQAAGPTRPQAPVRETRKPNRNPLYAVAAALGLIVVAAIGTLAFLRRNEPPAVSNPRPAPASQPAAQAPKTDERVASAPAETQPRPAAPAANAPPPAPAPAPPPAAPAQPAIAVANRLVMAMEGTDRADNVVVRQGVVVWRTEMVSGTQGQPPQLVVKAILDVPDARMRGEMTIQKNRDPAFPASHTIQVQFTPGQGSEFGAVRNLSQIELRQSENQTGYPLAGQGIAVVENLFLLALSQAEPALSRNMEMMRARPIMYVEFQSAAGRRGALVIEKGISGQQAFDEAFRAWQ